VLWGNTDNTSCQGAEHAHIELIKSVAHLTNNKDIFLCILRFHTRAAFLQHYGRIVSELQGSTADQDDFARDATTLADRNFNVACETGIRYPTLSAMLNRGAMTIRRSVKPIPVNACVLLGYPHISLHLHGISCDILMYCMQSGGSQSKGSVALDLDLLKPWRVLASAAAAAQDDTEHPLLHHAKPQQAPKVWLEYANRKHHPALQWLPTKLAEWIGENLQDDLGSLTRPIPEGAGPQRS
jgi:hypothetical protein